MKLFNKFLSWAVAKAKKSRLLQNLAEKPISIDKLPQMGVFVDSGKRSHILYQNLREIIKPGSSKASSIKPIVKNNAFYLQKLEEADLDLASIHPLIQATGKKLENAVVLEIGCDIGSFCCTLAKHGAEQITGTDTSEYKSSSTNDDRRLIQTTLEDERKLLVDLSKSTSVVFKEDDICKSSLPSDTFDIVFSFDVLEHLSNPKNAFFHIQRILKPGGIAIHRYNPFFSINGGHSACTLDFLWGHVRLNSEDFVKYLEQIRPHELEYAKAFYFNGLNRMSLRDMKDFSTEVGLEVLGSLQFGKEQTMRMFNRDIWEECHVNYKNICMEDLVSSKVVVIQKKYE